MHIHRHLYHHRLKRLFFAGVILAISLLFPRLTEADNPNDPYITYTPISGWVTNQNIIASVQNLATGWIINNSGSDQYTFTTNGSFVFEYSYQTGIINYLTASVDWIDKIPPQATISYNTTSATIHDIIASLTWESEPISVISPISGSNTYILTGNGEILFVFADLAWNTGAATGYIDWIYTYTGDNTCNIDDLRLHQPSSDSEYAGSMQVSREPTTQDCPGSTLISVQLYDHNNQRIDLYTWTLDTTGISFDTLQLAYTWLYTITGLHLSGTTFTWINESGQVYTGIYESDQEYIIYTGAYIGNYSNYFTGYKIRIIDASGTNLLAHDENIFTIDNRPPSITILSTIVDGSDGETVTHSGNIVLTVSSNKVLDNISYIVNNSQVAGVQEIVNDNVVHTIPLQYVTQTGQLEYTIVFTDVQGNTWSYEAIIPVVLVEQIEQSANISAGGSSSSSSTSNTSASRNTTTATTTQAVEKTENTMPDDKVKSFKDEIVTFNTCKAALKTSTVSTMTKNNKKIQLSVPEFKKNSLKIVVNIFVAALLKKTTTIDLTDTHITELTLRTDNFLAVLKYLQDTNNPDCEHNLSSYYILQFADIITALGLATTDLSTDVQ